jgi:hypothetical protein
MRRATGADIPLVVNLKSEFYAEAGYDLNHAHVEAAFAALVADERLGYVWIIQAEHQDVGHMVITLRYVFLAPARAQFHENVSAYYRVVVAARSRSHWRS